MGDAYLMNSGGGMRFLGLLVQTSPHKTTYIPGQMPDMSGSVIAADMGRDTVILSSGEYSVTPNRALTAADTYLRVTATIDGTTHHSDIPITVGSSVMTLDAATWDDIAFAAAAGTASNHWALGDVKRETIGGTTHDLVLVGFGQDSLAPTDIKYNTLYNNGNNKACMTFIDYTGVYDWYHDASEWPKREAYAVRTALPAWMDKCPDSLRNAMRRVAKTTNYKGSSEYVEVTYDKVFLLSHREAFGAARDNDFPSARTAESTACSWYQYFAAGGALPHSNSDTSPLRSMHTTCTAQVWHNSAIGTDGDISELSGNNNAKHILFPVFCI